jgi:hypothetical protein
MVPAIFIIDETQVTIQSQQRTLVAEYSAVSVIGLLSTCESPRDSRGAKALAPSNHQAGWQSPVLVQLLRLT